MHPLSGFSVFRPLKPFGLVLSVKPRASARALPPFPRLFPVFPRAQAGLLLEQAAEVLRILEAELVGHLAHRADRQAQLVLRLLYQTVEYTGLWCGYCPAGYVAIEELTEELGKDFVVLSYHNGGDEMSGKWRDIFTKGPKAIPRPHRHHQSSYLRKPSYLFIP